MEGFIMGSMISWMNFQYFSWNLFCGYLWVMKQVRAHWCGLHQNPRWLDLWVFFENRVTENPIVYHNFPHMFPILQSMCFLLLSQVQTYPTILLLVIYIVIVIYIYINIYKITIYPMISHDIPIKNHYILDQQSHDNRLGFVTAQRSSYSWAP
jgi:hypothetical protein